MVLSWVVLTQVSQVWLPSSAGLAWAGHPKWLVDGQQLIMLSNGNSAARTLPHSVFPHPLGSSQQGRWLLSGHILRTSVLREQEVDAARPVRAVYRTREIIPVNSMGQCIPKPVPMEGRREIDPCLHGRVPRSHCRPGAAGDTAMVTFTKHGLLHHGK